MIPFAVDNVEYGRASAVRVGDAKEQAALAAYIYEAFRLS
jgi:hypothetical protein